MIGDIRTHLALVPFRPFSIRMASGHEYAVPTIDHIWLPPGQARVFVSDDDGYSSALPALLMSALVVWPEEKPRAKRRPAKRS